MLKVNMNSELIKKFYRIIEEINVEIEACRYNDGLELINEAFKEFFRLDASFFNSLSVENLLDMIKTNDILDVHKGIIMSKLLMKEGIIYEQLYGMEESFYFYQKSMYIYLEVFSDLEDKNELIEFEEDIRILLDRISEYKLSAELMKKIIKYHLNRSEYDKAENMLYELMEDNPGEEKDYAISFYKGLLLKEDVDLNKGGLPREEILQALDSLN